MTVVQVDREKVTRMVAALLGAINDKGAHPGEMVLALAEALGRIVVAVREAGGSEVVQRELLDLAVKQMTNAIIAGRGGTPSVLIVPDSVKH